MIRIMNLAAEGKWDICVDIIGFSVTVMIFAPDVVRWRSLRLGWHPARALVFA